MEAVPGTGWTSYASASILAIAQERPGFDIGATREVIRFLSRNCIHPENFACFRTPSLAAPYRRTNLFFAYVQHTSQQQSSASASFRRHTSLFSPLAHNSDLLGYLTLTPFNFHGPARPPRQRLPSNGFIERAPHRCVPLLSLAQARLRYSTSVTREESSIIRLVEPHNI